MKLFLSLVKWSAMSITFPCRTGQPTSIIWRVSEHRFYRTPLSAWLLKQATTINKDRRQQISTNDHKQSANDLKPPASNQKPPSNNCKSASNDQKKPASDYKLPANDHKLPRNGHTCTRNQKADVLFLLPSPSHCKYHFNFEKHMQSVRETASYFHTTCA